MCKAIDDMCKDSKMEGIAEGKKVGMMKGKQEGIQAAILKLYNQHLITKETALQELSVDETRFNTLCVKYSER